MSPLRARIGSGLIRLILDRSAAFCERREVRLDDALLILERSFSDCTSYTFELQAYDVPGDMAYAAGLVAHRCADVNPPSR